MIAAAGCAPSIHFADRAILWHDPDDRPIPVPRARDVPYHWVALRDAVFRPLDRALDLDYGREATNVNAVDETPDSSWWTDRRRIPGQARPRTLSDEEMRRGAFGERPDPLRPLTIIKGKQSGGNLGFVVEDALGRRFAIKIDPPGLVGMDTSTEVVVSRLAWAAGWNVPAETLLDLRASDLVLSPKATTHDADGNKVPLDETRLRALLARAPVAEDGSIRALASLWIDGAILGPYAYFGRRRDDPNDRVPHQDRRDLRGYGVFCAWVNNIDTTEANTLDSYIGRHGRGHVVHWQQDVGGSFGARAATPIDYWMGYDTYLAPTRMFGSLLSFGLWRRPWEGEAVRVRRAREVARFPELGFFDAAAFEPRHWHPIFDNPAFQRATARDRYWGATRVVQIGASELRAAIAAGHYRRAAAERLFDILWRRRQAIARAYFGAPPALDYFRVERDRLCGDDLWLAAGLGGARGTAYQADGRVLDGDARCTPVGRGYRVVTLRVRRPGQRRFGPPVRVHLIDRRIVGVVR
jgi:hypothetical protein